MKIKLITLLPIVIFTVISCGEQQKNQIKKEENANAEIEKQSGIFSPAQLQDKNNIHYAVNVSFNNSAFTFIPNSFSVRSGKLPKSASDQFPFKINFIDSAGRIISNYAIEDPRIIRSCDSGSITHIKVLNSGKFTLLLPSNKEIRTVQIIPNQKEKYEMPMNLSGLIDSINAVK